MGFPQRLDRLKQQIRRQKVPVLLVTNPVNIAYLTGIDLSEGILLVRTTSATLFVDGRYTEAARAKRSKSFAVLDRAEILAALKKTKRCGFEEQYVTAGTLRRWKRTYPGTTFVHTSGMVEIVRRVKDAEEIRMMKHALAMTDAILQKIPRWLKPGITERELARRILREVEDLGADGLAFETIVAFGKNTSLPHHHPGTAKLRKRDIVQIDMGARFAAYCSDRSEVYFVGKPTREQQRVYAAVLEAKECAKSLLKPGIGCADLDTAARDVLMRYGFDGYPHALGHGVGLEIHEGVSLSVRSNDALLAGEVVTIEPGIYLPGQFGIRLEDTIFVQ